MCFRARLHMLCAVGLAIFLGAGSSWAADVAFDQSPPPSSMAITSESMTVKTLDHRVIFDRSVLVKKDDLDLRADRVEVVLVAPPGAGAAPNPLVAPSGGALLAEDNVDRIEAQGHVVVVQGKKNATADHAVYHREGERIVLTGKPETWEDGYRIQGSKITIWLKEQRSEVEDSHVVIYPEERHTPQSPESSAGNAPVPPPAVDR